MLSSANILVIDDEESVRVACVQTLRGQGYTVQAVENGANGLEMMKKESFDVVVLDLKMPGIPGMEVLRRIRENSPNAMVIVITGYGTIDVAVQAMREGAYDFLTKPFTPEVLHSAVEKAVNGRRLILQNVSMAAPPAAGGQDIIIGRSKATIDIAQLIRKVAPTDSTVLIDGETGVGKELVARTIHRLSKRHDKPFVTVDCGTLVETLFESEMFGHVKGAYTGAVDATRGKFEFADGGTIFLDEIANISIGMQARLLRVLQEREISRVGSLERIRIDVRITTATNRDLQKEIREGRFREELFYRLNVVPIHVPPLRERKEDIPLLVDFFLKSLSNREKIRTPKLSDEAMRRLVSYNWPGNIRELKNAIEHALVTCEGNTIGPEAFSFQRPEPAESGKAPDEGGLAGMEKKEIVRVLDQFDGHKTKAAKHLGINRKTLREKIRRYGIES